MNLEHTAFWVQVHSLPTSFINPTNAQKLGDRLGELEAVDLDNSKNPDSKNCMRLRIKWDVKKPFTPGLPIERKNLPNIWIHLKYEKLADFCVNCGKIDHISLECLEDKKTRLNAEETVDVTKLGHWIRAMPGRKNIGIPVKSHFIDGLPVEQEERAPPRVGVDSVFGQNVSTFQVAHQGSDTFGEENPKASLAATNAMFGICSSIQDFENIPTQQLRPPNSLNHNLLSISNGPTKPNQKPAPPSDSPPKNGHFIFSTKVPNQSPSASKNSKPVNHNPSVIKPQSLSPIPKTDNLDPTLNNAARKPFKDFSNLDPPIPPAPFGNIIFSDAVSSGLLKRSLDVFLTDELSKEQERKDEDLLAELPFSDQGLVDIPISNTVGLHGNFHFQSTGVRVTKKIKRCSRSPAKISDQVTTSEASGPGCSQDSESPWFSFRGTVMALGWL